MVGKQNYFLCKFLVVSFQADLSNFLPQVSLASLFAMFSLLSQNALLENTSFYKPFADK